MKIEAIPLQLESVEGKVERTNILLQQYSGRQLEESPDKREKEVAGEISDLFVRRSSTTGVLLLYACSLAYTKKKPFSLEELTATTKLGGVDYALGFLVAAMSAGIFEATLPKDIWNIISMTDKLQKALEFEFDQQSERFSERISKVVKNSSISPERQTDYVKERITLIEQYFQ